MSEKFTEDLVDITIRNLWKVPLYDIKGQKEVLCKMIDENATNLSVIIKSLKDKLSEKTKEVNRHWEDSYNEVYFDRDR